MTRYKYDRVKYDKHPEVSVRSYDDLTDTVQPESVVVKKQTGGSVGDKHKRRRRHSNVNDDIVTINDILADVN